MRKNWEKRKKTGAVKAASLFLVTGAVLGLSGCRGGGEKLQLSSRGHLFGATYMSSSNPFFDVLHESIKEVIESNGDILIRRDPAQNQEKQNEQIQDMIDEGIEALFLNPVNWEEVEPALIACREAGIPVFNIDTKVKNTEYVVSIIETNNYEAGVQCASDMMERVQEARIVILDYPVQTSVSERVEGFLDTIADRPQYQVVFQAPASGELEVSAEVMTEFLEKEVDFDVIFGGNDPMALGALSALQQNDREEEILIYGVDGSPDSKAMINMGYVTGSCAQSPKSLGRTAAELVYRYLDGESVDKYFSIEPEMVTKENIGEFTINGWQ